MRIRIDTNLLKVYLYKHFENAFNREWDNLPEYMQEHWTEVANEMAEELITEGIVDIVP